LRLDAAVRIVVERKEALPMGLFDTVRCEYPLLEAAHQDLEFQTKDFDCLLDDYLITREGWLIRCRRSWGRGPERDVERPFHGDVTIYGSVPDGDGLVEYVVRFTHGRVEWIRPLEQQDDGPADEPAPVGDEPAITVGQPESAPSSAQPGEMTLLENLRRRRPELEALLEQSSDHWGFEDPVYRFYHQSFKLYALQQRTEGIVRELASLVPHRPLHAWFREIVDAGSGRRFTPEDNAHWTQVTRPILEAFFHARYFLDMAVRYAHLEAPPNPLPSGYAALLSLYGLR
jgi:hypothetical protein